MTDALILVAMGVFAILAIHSRLLRIAVIHLAVVSLLAAFLYMRYAAPELAIAEAVIGSGLVSLLYLAALKRNRVYTIGVVGSGEQQRLADAYMRHIERSRALREIRQFFLIREYEVQIVFIPDSLEEALDNDAYDLVLREDEEGIAAYTDDESYIMMELEMMIQMRGSGSDLQFRRYHHEEQGIQIANDGADN